MDRVGSQGNAQGEGEYDRTLYHVSEGKLNLAMVGIGSCCRRQVGHSVFLYGAQGVIGRRAQRGHGRESASTARGQL
jgi:hypothetical protein